MNFYCHPDSVEVKGEIEDRISSKSFDVENVRKLFAHQ